VLSKLIRWRKPRRPSPDELPYRHHSLFFWKPEAGTNFGDHLAKIIVGQILASRGLSLDDQTPSVVRILATGSILHFARDGDVIWGSGVNGKVPETAFTARHLDVRAVRGPLTAEFLRRRGIAVPDVYGDPGLLVRTLFADRFAVTGARDHVFVPNLHDLKLIGNQPDVVSPMQGWNAAVAEILSARLVLASSLHGLVIAEAFGIPARYVRLSETENLFKYQDYVYGTGRTELVYARSIEEGLEMGGMPPVTWAPDALLAAFPWDLWP